MENTSSCKGPKRTPPGTQLLVNTGTTQSVRLLDDVNVPNPPRPFVSETKSKYKLQHSKQEDNS